MRDWLSLTRAWSGVGLRAGGVGGEGPSYSRVRTGRAALAEWTELEQGGEWGTAVLS